MLGLDADAVFTHPDIKPWRRLDDRENCTLDASLDGHSIRLHIKRYPAQRGRRPADDEVAAIKLLQQAQIPTVPLVAWGELADGRSFIITEDLTGFAAADKLLEEGLHFANILNETADLTAKLHNANLHHRDLYLCHFFYNCISKELRLIDVARVRRLPGWPTRSRWIHKDLGQFWYSTQSLSITDEQRDEWLKRYVSQRGTGVKPVHHLRRAIQSVSNRIARHDEKLRRRQPHRNISIPMTP
jgi:hypothetical protein